MPVQWQFFTCYYSPFNLNRWIETYTFFQSYALKKIIMCQNRPVDFKLCKIWIINDSILKRFRCPSNWNGYGRTRVNLEKLYFEIIITFRQNSTRITTLSFLYVFKVIFSRFTYIILIFWTNWRKHINFRKALLGKNNDVLCIFQLLFYSLQLFDKYVHTFQN